MGVEQSEAIRVVGMSPACEAEWLAARELPWPPGQSDPISTVLLVGLMLTFQLSQEGWSPKESRSVVDKAIGAVFYNAFLFADHSLEVTGLPLDVERFRQSFIESDNMANELTGGPHRYSAIVRDRIDPTYRLARQFLRDEKEAVQSSNEGLCLRAVARDLVSKLGRPLLSVELVNHAPADHEVKKWLSSARAT